MLEEKRLDYDSIRNKVKKASDPDLVCAAFSFSLSSSFSFFSSSFFSFSLLSFPFFPSSLFSPLPFLSLPFLHRHHHHHHHHFYSSINHHEISCIFNHPFFHIRDFNLIRLNYNISIYLMRDDCRSHRHHHHHRHHHYHHHHRHHHYHHHHGS